MNKIKILLIGVALLLMSPASALAWPWSDSVTSFQPFKIEISSESAIILPQPAGPNFHAKGFVLMPNTNAVCLSTFSTVNSDYAVVLPTTSIQPILFNFDSDLKVYIFALPTISTYVLRGYWWE